jgi:hypothetical protein
MNHFITDQGEFNSLVEICKKHVFIPGVRESMKLMLSRIVADNAERRLIMRTQSWGRSDKPLAILAQFPELSNVVYHTFTPNEANQIRPLLNHYPNFVHSALSYKTDY